jgi:hypothetical protein
MCGPLFFRVMNPTSQARRSQLVTLAKVVGSNPTPATILIQEARQCAGLFFFGL